MRKQLQTWDNRSEFEYEGSVAEGTQIFYGTGQESYISKAQYQALLQHFAGRTVKCGTSRTNPPEDSVGAWLQKYVQNRTLASYVCAILITEKYAAKGNARWTISFK